MAESRAGSEEKNPKERTVIFTGLKDLTEQFKVSFTNCTQVQFSEKGMQLLYFEERGQMLSPVLCKDFNAIRFVFQYCGQGTIRETFLKKSGRLAVWGSSPNGVEVCTFEDDGSNKGVCTSRVRLPCPPSYEVDNIIALPIENEFEMLGSLHSKKENLLVLYFITQNKFMRYNLPLSRDPKAPLSFNKLYFVEPHFLLVQVSTAPDKNFMYRVPLSQLQEAKALEGHFPFVRIPATAFTDKGGFLFSAFPWCRTFAANGQLYHANWDDHSCHRIARGESISEYSVQLAQGYVPTEHLKDEWITGIYQEMLITTRRMVDGHGMEIYAYNENLTEKQLVGVTEDANFLFCDSAPTKELGTLRKVDDEFVLRLMHLPEFKPLPKFSPNQKWVSNLDQAVDKRFPQEVLSIIAQYHGGFFGTDRDEKSESAKRRRIEIELKKLNAEENKDPVFIQKKMALTELHRLLMLPDHLTVEASVQSMLQNYFTEKHHPDVIAFIVALVPNLLGQYLSYHPAVDYRYAEKGFGEEKSKERVVSLNELQRRLGMRWLGDIQVNNNRMQLLEYTDQLGNSAQAICRNFEFLQHVSDLYHGKSKAFLLKKSDKIALLLFDEEEGIQVRTFQYGKAHVGLLASVCTLPNPKLTIWGFHDYSRLIALPEDSEYEMVVSLYSPKEKDLRLYFINQDQFVEYKLSSSMEKAKKDQLVNSKIEKLLQFNEIYFIEPNFLMVYMKVAHHEMGFMYRVPLSHQLLGEAKSLEDFSWAKVPSVFQVNAFSAFPGCSTFVAYPVGRFLYRVNWESHSCEGEKLHGLEIMNGIFQGELITTHYNTKEIIAYREDLTKIEVIGKVEEGDEFFDSAATNELGIKTVVDGEYVLRFIRMPELKPDPQFVTELGQAIPEYFPRSLLSLIAQYHGGFFDRKVDENSKQQAERLSVIKQVIEKIKKLHPEESKEKLAFTELQRLLMLPEKLSVEACVERMRKSEKFSPEILTLINDFVAPHIKRRSAGPGP